MQGSLEATQRMLVSRVEVLGMGPLVLRQSVLIEAGQRYWVDEAESELVVETAGQEQRRYLGDFFGPPAVGLRPFSALICAADGVTVLERAEVIADSVESAKVALEAVHGSGSVLHLTDLEASDRLR